MRSKTITIDEKTINEIDFSTLLPYCFDGGPFDCTVGAYKSGNRCAYYKLLSFVSSQVTSPTVVEIGTYVGQGTLALYHGGKKVITYDVYDWIKDKCPKGGKSIRDIPDISFHVASQKQIGNYPLDDIEVLMDTDLIFLDVDPHHGEKEKKIYDALLKNGYRGTLVMDDIFFHPFMKNFWDSIRLTKHDVSFIGNSFGTGIVVFDDSRYNFIVNYPSR